MKSHSNIEMKSALVLLGLVGVAFGLIVEPPTASFALQMPFSK